MEKANLEFNEKSIGNIKITNLSTSNIINISLMEDGKVINSIDMEYEDYHHLLRCINFKLY